MKNDVSIRFLQREKTLRGALLYSDRNRQKNEDVILAQKRRAVPEKVALWQEEYEKRNGTRLMSQ